MSLWSVLYSAQSLVPNRVCDDTYNYVGAMGIHRYLKKLTTKQTQSARVGAPSKPPTSSLVSWLTTHYKLALFIILPLGLFLPLPLLVQLPGFDYLVTTSSKLGSFMPFAILVGLLITAATSYFIIDYHLHRKPLRDEQPKIAYTPLHHIKVVSLPLVKYRWRSVSYWIFVGTTSLVALSYLLGVSMVGLAAPGSLTVTINQKTGTADSNPSYTSVFTVQFSEPIDEATLTNSDITLGGTAPGQAIQSITEAGTFNKTTYEVRIQATSAGTITPTIAPELITAQNGASGTNQASTSTDNSVTYNGDWAPGEFIMRVKTDNPGGSSSNQYIIPTDPGMHSAFSFDVDCNNDGINEFTNQAGNVTCTYGSPGQYDIAIAGIFPHLDGKAIPSDQAKIVDIKQWGSIAWEDMDYMFENATNIVTFTANDAPDLSNVTNMRGMFYGATMFNANINYWDVSNVFTMNHLFRSATSFNQPLNNWDVSNVINVNSLFLNATSFNQPLNNWDVSNVTSTALMFANAVAFNQPLSSWNVEDVSSMGSMFTSAESFDQSLASWDVSGVNSMDRMFGDIVEGIRTDYEQIYGPYNTWAQQTKNDFWAWVSQVLDRPTDESYVPNPSGLSAPNYDATLTSWSGQNLKSNVSFGAGTSKYCNSETQRQSIITNFNWTITDGGKDCSAQPQRPFIMTAKTDNPGSSNSNQYTIPTNNSYTYNYNVDCNNDGTNEFTNQTGDVTCTYGSPGEYDIAITGTFPHMMNNDSTDAPKIIDVKQWGDIAWQDMSYMFYGATNITTFSASDTPDLSTVTDMSFMFGNATNFNDNIESWDISHITTMNATFILAQSFNQPLNNWNVSNVVYMTQMFMNATSFNQPLNNWNVSNVTNMSWMFDAATSFNQPLNNWNVSNLTNIQLMFGSAISFNQPLNNWNVSNLTDVSGMFLGATSFNQSLASWNISNVVGMQYMFGDYVEFMRYNTEQVYGTPYDQWTQQDKDAFWNSLPYYVGYPVDESYVPNPSGLSIANYDATLIAWSAQNLESSVTFDAGKSKYCNSETQRQSIITNFTWTINDAGKDCSLGAPQNLTGTPHTTSIEVNWDDLMDAAYYQLEYKPTSSSTWIHYPDNTINASYLEVFGLDPETSYDFRVKAFDSTDDGGEWSSTITISTLAQTTYHITDCQEFQAISINPVTLVPGDPAGKYVIDNDIDCSETANWTWSSIIPFLYQPDRPPGFIGIFDFVSFGTGFTGDIDGQGHTISNIHQDTTYLPYGNIIIKASGASVRDITFDNYTRYIGAYEIAVPLPGAFGSGLVGYGDSLDVSNVHVTNLSLTGYSNFTFGGLIGEDHNSVVADSSVRGSINLSSYIDTNMISRSDGVATDSSGNIYVLDTEYGQIKKFDNSNNLIAKWGSEGSGVDQISSSAEGIALDSTGNIYVADSGNNRIQKFTNSGVHIRQFSIGGSDVAVDSNGNIYVLNNTTIHKLDSDGNELFVINGYDSDNDGFITGGETFTYSRNIAVDSSNNLFVIAQSKINKYDSSGNELVQFGSIGSGAGQFLYGPEGIAVDGLGNIYTGDYGNHDIKKFDSSGNFVSVFSNDSIAAPDHLSGNSSMYMAADSSGGLIVSMRGILPSLVRFNSSGLRNYVFPLGSLATDVDGRFIAIGGLVGSSFGTTISKSYTDLSTNIQVTPGNDGMAIGGLVGHSLGAMHVNNSYSKGSYSVDGGIVQYGGLAGGLSYYGELENSYSAVSAHLTNNVAPLSDGLSATITGGAIGSASTDSIIKNVFSVGSISSNITSAGLIGFVTRILSLPYQADNISNNYYDRTVVNQPNCVDQYLEIDDITDTSTLVTTPAIFCTPVNTDGSQPNYFKNNSTNPPLNQWDFTSIWKTNCTNYPDFVGSAGCNPSTPSPSPTPTSTPSPTPTRSPTPTSQPTLTTSPTPTVSTDPNVSPPASGSDGGTSSGSTRPTTKTSPKPSGPGLATDQVGFFSKGGPLWSFAVVTAPGLPFMFVSLLLLIALAYAIQSWREYRFERSVQALIDRYQATDQHIHDFINITAHYLNTPVAILQNALDLLQSQQLVAALTYTSLADQLKELGQFASGLQHTTQESLANTQSTAANTMPGSHKANSKLTALIALKDRPVWISLLAVAIVIAVVDITLTLTGAYIVSGLRVINQLAFFIFCLILILVSGYLYHKHKTRRQKQVDLLREIRNLHQTKQAFLDESSQKLQSYIDFLTTNSSELQAHPEQSKLYLNGLAMLTELGRALGFVTTHAGAVNTTTTSLVAPAIQAVLPGLQQQAQARNITLEVDTPSALTAQAEPEHLGELTEILVGNAIKFSPEGSKVSLQVKATGQHVTIAVTDAGSGLSDSARQHLFEPFSRGTSTETYDSQGLGMGLYNAQFLVQSLGGIIKLQATRPTGTLATITLHSGKLAKLPG